MTPTKSGAYALACYHALRGDRNEAMRLLEGSRAKAWIEPGLARDPNLATLRSDARFQRLAAWMAAQPTARVHSEWERSR